MDMDFILLLTTALCMNMFNVEKYFVTSSSFASSLKKVFEYVIHQSPKITLHHSVSLE
jgi:hypothetical protein